MPPLSLNDIECDVLLESGDWPAMLDIPKVVHAALSHAGHNTPCEISIVLADDPYIQVLNRDYRNKDKPTNVLSFPQDEPSLLGDIIVSIDTLRREADEQQKSFDAHFTHMLVHGCLHLLGHDHIEDDEAKTMEALEIKILQTLNIKNPYEI